MIKRRIGEREKGKRRNRRRQRKEEGNGRKEGDIEKGN